MNVIVYAADGRRAKIVTEAAMAGLSRHGVKARLLHERHYRGVDADVALFYGLQGNLGRALKDYPAADRRAVYIDLGYWGRRDGGRYAGFHKVSVDDRHPTAYFQRRAHPPARLKALGVACETWRPHDAHGRGAGHILLAGMGPKAAQVLGLGAEAWERGAIAAIRKVTDRPIVYRPKPSWKEARNIEGCIFSAPDQPLTPVLATAAAVVTHHSNVAVEGLAAGVPAFCWQGVATKLSLDDLARIETPWRPDGREQFLADVAWVQWSVAEIAAGTMWSYLRDEGLV